MVRRRYVPLSDRADWDGEVRVLPAIPEEQKKNWGRAQGKKKRNSQRKCGNGG